MKRLLWIVGLMYLAVAQMAWSQTNPTVPSTDELKGLLAKAYDQPNLWADGSPAFHLRARTKAYGAKGAFIEGTYELWWVSKDRWREDVEWTGKKSSQVVAENLLWRTAEDTHRADTLRVTNVLKTWQGIFMDLSKASLRPKADSQGEPPAICVSGHKVNMPAQTICLDPTTGSLSETQLGDQRWEYSDYTQLSTKRFPRRIEYLDGKKPIVEVNTELLEKLDAKQSPVFAPPSGIESRAWCSDMIAPRPTHYGPSSMDFRQKQQEGNLEKSGIAPPVPARYAELGMIVFAVDDKGRATDVEAFLPGGLHAIDKGEKRGMLLTTFRVASCHGKPVAGELILW